MESGYNWKRFWYLRSSKPELDNQGYFIDPDSSHGNIYNPNAVTFSSLEHFPILILLGEPGIGKSHTLKSEWKSFYNTRDEKGIETKWLDLSSYGNEDRLVRDLFEEYIANACSRDTNLLIFLDSLDECLLNIRHLSSLLINELEKYPSKKLKFV